jgi:hypothetical protein
MNQPSTRVLAALDHVQENERLTSDLSDHGSAVLLAWVDAQIRAADYSLDAAAFGQEVAHVCRAARRAARQAAGDEARVTELATAALADLKHEHSQAMRKG